MADEWALEGTNGRRRATKRASVGGTKGQDPRTRSSWENKDLVPILMTSRGGERWGGTPATASSCEEQMAHPNPPWGCQKKKNPGRGGRDSSVTAMSHPPRPHQGSWADRLEKVGEQQWVKPISSSNNVHPSRLLLLCRLIAPMLPHCFLHEGHQSWDDMGTCLPSLSWLSLAADLSFCSFLPILQMVPHQELLCCRDPGAGTPQHPDRALWAELSCLDRPGARS